MKVVVYLEWREKCFRANAADLAFLRSLLPARAKVVRVRGDRSFLRELPTATHVITWHFRPEWYALAPQLELVATPAAGREFVAESPIVHFGHFHGGIIAETVLAFVLAHCRGLFAKRGRWERTYLSDRCFTLSGTKAVIVGYGSVGRAIGSRLSALGVSVRGFTHAETDRLRETWPRALVAELRGADWLIAALPADASTDDLIGAKFLAKLPRRCALVNVGRGNCVDEHALYKALKGGRLAAAYLDVIKSEPSATVLNRPGHERRLFDLGNAFILPHASAFSPDYLRRAFEELKRDGCLG